MITPIVLFSVASTIRNTLQLVQQIILLITISKANHTMELRQLRYLLTVADEANFTRAADKLFISQSALSQQIQALEQDVGTVLVNRSRRGITLTDAGQILYHHAQRVIHEIEEAVITINEMNGLTRGELSIGVVQTVNDYLMPSVVTDFTARYPSVKLSIAELSADDIELGLESAQLNVGIGFTPPTNTAVQAQPLFDESLVLVVRDDHPLAGQASIPVNELDNLPMIMLSQSFCTRRLWEDNARLAGAQPHITLELNTVSSILSAVLKTGMATILPHLTLIEARSSKLVEVQLTDPRPSREVGVLWHSNHYVCSASQAFIEIVKQVSRTLSPNET